jgi:hypothetical protein
MGKNIKGDFHKMARKRSTENEIVVSSSVPARHKSASTRSRRNQAPAASDNVIEPASAPVEPAPYAPSHEEIAALAYSYWEARGYQGGCPTEDWTRAESELRASRTVSIAHA